MEELESIYEKPICSKGVEKESCLMYRTGNCCDYKKDEKK